jgi:hypothetical protein
MTTDFDAFDRRLAEAFRAYASDAPTVDPAAFARSIVLGHPRRGTWASAVRAITARRAIWVLLALLIMLAALAALGGVGAPRLTLVPAPSGPDVAPAGAIPDELYGEWRAAVAAAGPQVTGGEYAMRLSDPTLLTDPGGAPLVWAGTTSAVVGATGEPELQIHSGSACGDARYAIAGPDPNAEPSPGPSASGGNPTPIPGLTILERIGTGEPLRLVPITESCADRLAILTSGPWTHPTIELATGETHRSIDFTEPFSFALPDGNELPVYASFWGKGLFRLGNGWDWRGFFVDDLAVGADICHPARGRLADLPTTPKQVETWLRSSSGLRVGDPIELTVDGRTALSIPIESIDCPMWDPPSRPGTFYLGSRVYAIPTGDDLILFTATSWSVQDINPIADELVQSMRFD